MSSERVQDIKFLHKTVAEYNRVHQRTPVAHGRTCSEVI